LCSYWEEEANEKSYTQLSGRYWIVL